MHSSVCLESATAVAEPSARPALRWAYDRNGITTSDTAASTIPTVDGSASADPSSARIDSTDDVGGEREEREAITRRAVRSRASGSAPENCQATIAAELTSITESRPNPMSAVEPAIGSGRDGDDRLDDVVA